MNNVPTIQQFNATTASMVSISMELFVHYVPVIPKAAHCAIPHHAYPVTVVIIFLLTTNAKFVKMGNLIVIFASIMSQVPSFNVQHVMKDIF